MTVVLNNPITRWPVTKDETGAPVFSTPVLMQGRWESRQDKFMDAKGEIVVSRSVAYVDQDVARGDWVANGDYATVPLADPTTLPLTGVEAYECRNFTKIPDLRQIEYERKVYC